MASRHRNASPAPAGKDSPQPASPATSPRLAAEFPLDAPEAKESVTVTVRFRPLRLGWVPCFASRGCNLFGLVDRVRLWAMRIDFVGVFFFLSACVKLAGGSAGGRDRLVRGWGHHCAERAESQHRLRVRYVPDTCSEFRGWMDHTSVIEEL